ncbi:MAG: HAD superfamily hydrolase (TIGR01490 family) [Arenicella sp.]
MELTVALALFDLDNTLLNGDSDHSWGIYLAEIGAVDAELQRSKQDFFYQQYLAGELDIYQFCEFQFSVLTQHPLEQLHSWRADFLDAVIEPMIVNGKAHLLEKHRDAGDDILIITATNDFITAPIAERLGVTTLLATQAEFIDGAYTGKIAGTPCYQAGKVARLNAWLEEHDKKFEDSYFYSDSINDLPLLELVDTPIAVTPDDKLRAHANQLNWQVID